METKTLRGRQVIERIRNGDQDDPRVGKLLRMHERFEGLMALGDDQLRTKNSNARIEWPPARREDLDALRTRSLDEQGYSSMIEGIRSRKER